MGLSLEIVKGLCVVGMFFVGLLPALVPVGVQLCYRWRRERRAAISSEAVPNTRPLLVANAAARSRNDNRQLSKKMQLFISCLACFGAGVFITTFFLHMIGEVREAWGKWFQAAKIESSFPWAELFSVIGFILVMFIEQITMLCSHCRGQKRRKSSLAPSDGSKTNNGFAGSGLLPTIKNDPSAVDQQHNGRRIGSSFRNTDNPHYGTSTAQGIHLHERLSAEDISSNHREGSQLSMIHSGQELTAALPLATADVASVSAEQHTSLLAILRAVILLIALCFHSVFEGMAIGLMETQKTTLTLFFAVCIHHWINSFCLGLSVFQSGLRPLFIILLVTLFAVMSPIGIGIGLGVRTAPATLGRYGAIAILQGLSSGTFLYIVFIEILPREILKDELGGGDHDEHALFSPQQQQHQHKISSSKHDEVDHARAEQGSKMALVSPSPTHLELPSSPSQYKRPRRSTSVSSSYSTTSAKAAATFNFDKILKCTCFTIGVGLMAMVIALTGHDHEHGEVSGGTAAHQHQHDYNHEVNGTLVPHDHSD